MSKEPGVPLADFDQPPQFAILQPQVLGPRQKFAVRNREHKRNYRKLKK